MLNRQHTHSMEKKIIIDLVLKKRKQMARLGTRKLYYLLQPELKKLGINLLDYSGRTIWTRE